MKLFVKRVTGAGEDVYFTTQAQETSVPKWLLTGSVYLGSVSDDEDVYETILFCEFDNGVCTTPIEKSDLTPEETAKVWAAAAERAMHIALHRDNYAEFGAHLLNKHAECRNEATEDMALVAAALKERSAVFNEEDYEDF